MPRFDGSNPYVLQTLAGLGATPGPFNEIVFGDPIRQPPLDILQDFGPPDFLAASGLDGKTAAGDTIPADVTTPFTLAAGGSDTGFINFIGDGDWFRITLVAGQTYEFSLNGTGATPLDDPFLELFNSSGTLIASDDDGGPGLNSLLTFTASASGTYYLGAGAFSDETGGYQIAASVGAADAIPGDATTTATLAVGGSQTSSIDFAGDDDWFQVDLVAGQSYVFTLDGTGATPLGDPFLELYNSSGVLIARDDDGSPGGFPDLDSLLRFTVTQSGTYYVNARAFDTETGDYQISAAVGEAQDPLDTIDLGYTAPLHIDVYFATGGQVIEGTTALRSWTASEMDSAMSALATYSAVTNLTFSQTAVQADAEFVLVLADLGPGLLGQFFTLNGIGHGEFNANASSWSTAGLQPGGLGFVTLIHEFGHGLGLAHPHDNGGVSEIMQGVISEFDSYGTFLMNQGVFTTMTYNDGWPSQQGLPPDTFGMQATPMALDIALLQIRYGADADANLGNTIYALPTANAAGTFFASIWDAGGVDTIVSTSPTNSTIDLRAATLLNAAGGGGFVSFVNGIRGGFTIAAGAVIENATGGAGADTLIGNNAANVLQGGAGADSLDGGAGDDALVGGAGNDTLNGGAGVDRAWYSDAAGAVTVSLAIAGAQNTGGGGTDTLNGVENLSGSSFNDALTGSAGDNALIGFAGDDVLAGGAGADWLVGDVGDDRFVQAIEASIDRLFGDAGFDTIDYTGASGAVTVQLSGYATVSGGATLATFTGIEAAIGTSFNDALIGNGGANRLTGGNGADWIVGQGGDDVFVQGIQSGTPDRLFGDAGSDTIDYAAATAGVTVQLSGYSTSGGVTLATFNGIENAVGTAFSDVLVGTGDNNRIAGGAGADWLVGQGGDDWFVQIADTTSIDRLFGDAGIDTIDYSTAAAGVTIQLSGYSVSGGATLATFVSIENAIGTNSNDALIGNASDNRITGGAGADWLVGQGGADAFVYQTFAAGTDTVADFSRTDLDRIDLSAIDPGAAAGDQQFIFSTVRTAGQTGEIVATSTSATTTVLSLYLDADNVADQVISVIHQSGLVMNAGDFVL